MNRINRIYSCMSLILSLEFLIRFDIHFFKTWIKFIKWKVKNHAYPRFPLLGAGGGPGFDFTMEGCLHRFSLYRTRPRPRTRPRYSKLYRLALSIELMWIGYIPHRPCFFQSSSVIRNHGIASLRGRVRVRGRGRFLFLVSISCSSCLSC